ncbi:hypothetical protein [Dyella kyungheensis]|jgi:hypothetical protein|uniref:Uncharacterized protein n=1 Tax=Dyella kyungheensis TaxID=1242174 RepID=A0ABS2JLH7_9GAMM|nr:hypothetical protein [Dyella kyungheensis]MBM7119891.1 hypothetical protein [Dyella kyungheensis]
MVFSTRKMCAPLVLALVAVAGCSHQGDDSASTPPPAPASTAAAPAPVSPATPATAPTPAYPQSSPAPATTTH